MGQTESALACIDSLGDLDSPMLQELGVVDGASLMLSCVPFSLRILKQELRAQLGVYAPLLSPSRRHL
jgi:hypothetical protein